MASNLWFIYAISAALLWGCSYAISGKLMELHLSPALLLVIQYVISLPVYVGIALHSGKLKTGLASLAENPERLALLLVGICAILTANFLIMSSISLKNATVSSLIEITYPLFTCLFAYILFGERQFNLVMAFGAILIFAGVILIGIAGRTKLPT